MWPFKKKSPKPTNTTYITIPGRLVRVTLCEQKGFSAKDLEKIVEAMCVVSQVVNSTEFEAKVSFEYGELGTVHQRRYSSTTDTAIQVYDRIKGACEIWTGEGIDHEIDLSLQYYTSFWSKVIGFGVPHSVWINLNWKYYATYKPWQMAGNLFHEWLHKIGYDHASASDHTSVPYALGYLMEELGERQYVQALNLKSDVEVISRRIP